MSIAVPLYGFGAGGSSLYYSVVCSTTEPAKKEGRIWVKSAVPMTRFEVGNNLASAEVGAVVIGGVPGGDNPTSTNKTLDIINAKVAGIQNRLKLTPVSCKQVQGSDGNWVSVDAYVCHSNTWIQFFSAGPTELVLYSADTTPAQYTVLDGTAQENDAYLLIQGPTSGYARTGAIAYLGIDLTDYSKIEITYSNLTSAANASLRVFTGDSYSSAGTVATLNISETSGTFTLDVSSLTGNYGLRIAVYNEEATPSIRIIKLCCVG